MGCAGSTEDKHTLNVIANRPPIPQGHALLESLMDALEAEYVNEQEGAVGKWLEEGLPNFGRAETEKLPSAGEIEDMSGAQLREIISKANGNYQECKTKEELQQRAAQAVEELKKSQKGGGGAEVLAKVGVPLETFTEWVENVEAALRERATSCNNLCMIWKIRKFKPQQMAVAQPVMMQAQPQPMGMAVAQPAYGQQPMAVAQPAYGQQPMAVAQPAYGQQPMAVAQPAYGQQPMAVAQPAYGQQPMAVAQPVYAQGRF